MTLNCQCVNTRYNVFSRRPCNSYQGNGFHRIWAKTVASQSLPMQKNFKKNLYTTFRKMICIIRNATDLKMLKSLLLA